MKIFITIFFSTLFCFSLVTLEKTLALFSNLWEIDLKPCSPKKSIMLLVLSSIEENSFIPSI